ncbi:MAG: hypothetical protein GEU71_15030 [Actinobacteria bacterium]|nr:hypothetical protein [Actinomycetota bacterium]
MSRSGPGSAGRAAILWVRAPLILRRFPQILGITVLSATILAIAASSGPAFLKSSEALLFVPRSLTSPRGRPACARTMRPRSVSAAALWILRVMLAGCARSRTR